MLQIRALETLLLYAPSLVKSERTCAEVLLLPGDIWPCLDTLGHYDWEGGHEWRETEDAAELSPQLGMTKSLSSDVEEKNWKAGELCCSKDALHPVEPWAA